MMMRLLSDTSPQGLSALRPTACDLATDTAVRSSPASQAREPLAHHAPHPAAHRLTFLARRALIVEAELTPKPGLVDRRGNGAHTDLSLDLMRRSALAIEPYFYEMALVSVGTCPTQSLREQLALIGRQAERAMLEATGGSNSHKGAIWALGLLVSAAAMHSECNTISNSVPTVGAPDDDSAVATRAASPAAILGAGPAANPTRAAAIAAAAKDIASFPDRTATPRLVSHGDAVAKRYGVAGARGEALSGFPHVIKVALPILRRKRTAGATEQVARLDALLAIMAHLDDTCVLHRGGEAALAVTKAGAMAVATVGGSGTSLGRHRLLELDRRLLASNASPGGSADLLSAALFLDALERGQNDIEADESRLEAFHGTH